MLFNSLEFLIFFPIVVVAYHVLPRKIRYIWLLLASYFFYMAWNPKYIVLILSVTLCTYVGALLIDHFGDSHKKKIILVFGICYNLLVLFLFKYYGFFLDNVNTIFKAFNRPALQNALNFVLPVGISFYTFQGLGYLIDVYRGEIKAEKNLLKYALFISFFPQLVAGPIERSKNLLTQINNIEENKVNYQDLQYGIYLIFWGYFQKMVIADRISIFVDAIFDNLYKCGSIEVILGMLAFSIQIFCDFGGYSSIAIGAARIMGFNLMENFKAPYLAESIAEFWRCWHISLSTWFRDYIYIPLGGNRKGKVTKYRNVLITFAVSGLWHGANWTFVIWGALHGAFQIIEDVCSPVYKTICRHLNINTNVFSYHFGRILVTYLFTSCAWVFFRADSVRQAVSYFHIMLTKWNPWVLFDESLYEYGLDRREVFILFFSLLLLTLADVLRRTRNKNVAEVIMEQNYCFRIVALTLLIIYILVYGQYGIAFDSAKFIYFDF